MVTASRDWLRHASWILFSVVVILLAANLIGFGVLRASLDCEASYNSHTSATLSYLQNLSNRQTQDSAILNWTVQEYPPNAEQTTAARISYSTELAVIIEERRSHPFPAYHC